MKQAITSLLLILTCWQVNAQIPRGVPPVQSPNAASLGLFGDVPVSLFAGLPSVSVPLYVVQEGSLSVPITLDYHASGFRPDTHPGWVGMGWTLSCGGTITRTVHDRIDEYALPNDPTNPNNLGYYFQHSILSNVNWEQASFIENTLITGTYSTATDFNYVKDTEPDEFSFSFLGYSGSFYLNHDGNWKVKCDKSIKVEVITTPSVLISPPFTSKDSNNPYLKSFVGFILTGEDGTRYQFGGTADAIEYSTDFFEQGYSPLTANAWQLTKITSTDGRMINLTYKREVGDGQFINQMYYSVYQDLGTSVAQGGSNTTNFFFVTKSGCDGYSTSSRSNLVGAYQSGQLIAPVYLASITTSVSNVTFNSSLSRELGYRNDLAYQIKYDKFQNARPREYFLPMLDEAFSSSMIYPTSLKKLRWKKLDEISVSYRGQFIKKFQLGFSDYSGNETNADQQRLTLKSVKEIGYSILSGVTQKPPYLFEYNSQDIPNYFTGYLANSSDHWGFFNGIYASIDGTDYVNSYYQAREATTNVSFATLGMLTKVTYPTSGSTEFEYEQPRYGKSLNEDRSADLQVFSTACIAGGVRIKKIKSYPVSGSAQPLVKEYFYVTGYSNSLDPATLPSSGVLSGKSRYYFDDYRNLIVGYQTSSNPAVYSKKIFSSQPVIPASSNKGAHVGYSEVVEKRNDGGYTRYSYSNFDTGTAYRDELVNPNSSLMPQRTIYQPYASAEETRGKLLKEESYNLNNVNVKTRVIEYVAFNKQNEYVRSVQANVLSACPTSSTEGIEEGTAYKIYTYSYLPVRETETTYDPTGNSSITTVKNTQYSTSGYRLIASESFTDSKNQTTTTSYRYPFDISYTASQPPTNGLASAIYAMTAKNMVAYPIETITSRNGMVTAASVQTHNWTGTANASSILPYQRFELETPQQIPLAQYVPVSYSNAFDGPINVGPMKRVKNTIKYDGLGNPLNLLKDGGIMTSYVWSYNNTLPAAKVENAAPNDILADGFEEQVGNWDGGVTYASAATANGAHTGAYAGLITSFNSGDQYHSFSTKSLTITPGTKKYTVSGWVYSDGPQADLWIFKSRPQDIDANGNVLPYNNIVIPTYVEAVSANTVGKWIYLEKEVDVPADVIKLTLRLTNWARSGTGNTPGKVWFDDVRIHPANAQMTTYTHLPLVGVTSVSDANNRPVYYEYDALNRLSIVRDQNRNIVKQYQYHYKNQ